MTDIQVSTSVTTGEPLPRSHGTLADTIPSFLPPVNIGYPLLASSSLNAQSNTFPIPSSSSSVQSMMFSQPSVTSSFLPKYSLPPLPSHSLPHFSLPISNATNSLNMPNKTEVTQSSVLSNSSLSPSNISRNSSNSPFQKNSVAVSSVNGICENLPQIPPIPQIPHSSVTSSSKIGMVGNELKIPPPVSRNLSHAIIRPFEMSFNDKKNNVSPSANSMVTSVNIDSKPSIPVLNAPNILPETPITIANSASPVDIPKDPIISFSSPLNISTTVGSFAPITTTTGPVYSQISTFPGVNSISTILNPNKTIPAATTSVVPISTKVLGPLPGPISKMSNINSISEHPGIFPNNNSLQGPVGKFSIITTNPGMNLTSSTLHSISSASNGLSNNNSFTPMQGDSNMAPKIATNCIIPRTDAVTAGMISSSSIPITEVKPSLGINPSGSKPVVLNAVTPNFSSSLTSKSFNDVQISVGSSSSLTPVQFPPITAVKIEHTSQITNIPSESSGSLNGAVLKPTNNVNVWSPLHAGSIVNGSTKVPELTKSCANKTSVSSFITTSSDLSTSNYCNIKKESKPFSVSNLIPLPNTIGQGNLDVNQMTLNGMTNSTVAGHEILPARQGAICTTLSKSTLSQMTSTNVYTVSSVATKLDSKYPYVATNANILPTVSSILPLTMPLETSSQVVPVTEINITTFNMQAPDLKHPDKSSTPITPNSLMMMMVNNNTSSISTSSMGVPINILSSISSSPSALVLQKNNSPIVSDLPPPTSQLPLTSIHQNSINLTEASLSISPKNKTVPSLVSNTPSSTNSEMSTNKIKEISAAGTILNQPINVVGAANSPSPQINFSPTVNNISLGTPHPKLSDTNISSVSPVQIQPPQPVPVNGLTGSSNQTPINIGNIILQNPNKLQINVNKIQAVPKVVTTSSVPSSESQSPMVVSPPNVDPVSCGSFPFVHPSPSPPKPPSSPVSLLDLRAKQEAEQKEQDRLELEREEEQCKKLQEALKAFEEAQMEEHQPPSSVALIKEEAIKKEIKVEAPRSRKEELRIKREEEKAAREEAKNRKEEARLKKEEGMRVIRAELKRKMMEERRGGVKKRITILHKGPAAPLEVTSQVSIIIIMISRFNCFFFLRAQLLSLGLA